MVLCQSSGARKTFLQAFAICSRAADAICKNLGLVTFDEQAVKEYIDFITIHPDGTLELEIQELGLSLS